MRPPRAAATLCAAFMVAGCGAGDPPDDRACPAGTATAIDLAATERRAPVLGVARDGRAVAAWESTAGAPLQVAVRDKAGAWSGPRDLSSPDAEAPSVALGTDGGALVAWDGAPGGTRAVQTARVGGTGVPGPVTPLGVPGGVSPRQPVVAARPDGAFVAAWRASPGASLTAAVTRGAGWGSPVTLVRRGEVRTPQLVVGDDGRTLLAWLEGRGGHRLVRAAVAAPDGVWGPPVDVSAAGERAADPRVAVSRDGWMAVTWRAELGDHRQRVWLRLASPGGRWLPPRPVTPVRREALGLPRPPGPIGRAPAVALLPAGAALVAWADRRGDVDRAWLASGSPSGPLGAGTPLDTAPASGAPDLAVSPTGRGVVAWESLDGSVLSVRVARVRDDGMVPGSCRTVSTRGVEVAAPRVGVDASGRAVVVWNTTNRGGVRTVSLP